MFQHLLVIINDITALQSGAVKQEAMTREKLENLIPV